MSVNGRSREYSVVRLVLLILLLLKNRLCSGSSSTTKGAYEDKLYEGHELIYLEVKFLGPSLSFSIAQAMISSHPNY
jgi:hypothetical protein